VGGARVTAGLGTTGAACEHPLSSSAATNTVQSLFTITGTH
jgi:hypothetical protein